MPMPSPEDRPDIYDDYDSPATPRNLSAAYVESILPDHLKLGDGGSADDGPT